MTSQNWLPVGQGFSFSDCSVFLFSSISSNSLTLCFNLTLERIRLTTVSIRAIIERYMSPSRLEKGVKKTTTDYFSGLFSCCFFASISFNSLVLFASLISLIARTRNKIEKPNANHPKGALSDELKSVSTVAILHLRDSLLVGASQAFPPTLQFCCFFLSYQ